MDDTTLDVDMIGRALADAHDPTLSYAENGERLIGMLRGAGYKLGPNAADPQVLFSGHTEGLAGNGTPAALQPPGYSKVTLPGVEPGTPVKVVTDYREQVGVRFSPTKIASPYGDNAGSGR
jgi:hypothetical protein